MTYPKPAPTFPILYFLVLNLKAANDKMKNIKLNKKKLPIEACFKSKYELIIIKNNNVYL